jgi:5-methylcytosine-specific restriction endonuclease McrA
MNIYNDTPETAPKTPSTITTNAANIRALRSSSNYQKARDQYRQRAKTHHNKDHTIGAHCWICNEPINYQLKHPHPRSWSLDHAIPIKDNPKLFLNTSNFRSAHLDCNEHRGTDAPRIELGEPSEIW